MANEAFEYLNSWNKTAFEAVKKLTENNIRMCERLAQEQMNLVNCIASDGAKMMEVMGSARDPQEIMKKQSAMAEEAGKQIMKSARSCAEILAEAGQVYTDLCENNMEAANKVAANASKKAA